jgi:hypothetical protein
VSGGDAAAANPDEPDDPVAAYLSETLLDQTLAWRLPLTDEHLAELDRDHPSVVTSPVVTHTRFFKLTTAEKSWRDLSAAFSAGKSGNLRPWYRCLGILREHRAMTAIAETYYVCLDHKSEIASFYSHLDRARRVHTVRLHFFARDIPQREQLNLEQYAEDYLGYIVCREGELPLVGRALLRPPNYVAASTSISEDVNLLGQKLPIRGVPFMQQDERFAVCAHVAMWTLQYTAYRRGLTERRLIGQIVRDNRPLQPRGSQGLTDQQVIDGLAGIGFRAESMLTPDPESHSLPSISLADLANRLSDEAYEFARSQATPAQLNDVGDLVVDLLGSEPAAEPNTAPANPAAAVTQQGIHGDQVIDGADDGDAALEFDSEAKQALYTHEIQRALLDYFLRDWIDSGLPVYAALPEHALVVCGRSRGDRPTYYVHDDQNGPYLELLDLCHVDLPALVEQSGRFTDASAGTSEDVPPRDRLSTPSGQGTWNPTESAPQTAKLVSVLITATPHRLLLAPSAARRRAVEIVGPLPPGLARDRLAKAGEVEIVATMLMGIDYKRQRRARAADQSAEQALTAFSAVQLAEWVTVVEGIGPTGDSLWELVFDASSSNDTPLLQLARVLDTLLLTNPLENEIEHASVGDFTCGRVRAPVRVGKAPGSDVSTEGDASGTTG